jgi:hypothetical protein
MSLWRAGIGVAAIDPGEPPVSPDVLLARADAAMHTATRAGRSASAGFDLRRCAVTLEPGPVPRHATFALSYRWDGPIS